MLAKSTNLVKWQGEAVHVCAPVALPGGAAVCPLSRPSGAGYRCLADQHLPGPGCERLVHLLDATPLSRQKEQRLLVRSAEHDGEDCTVVLDALTHLAALADSHDCTRWGTDTSGVDKGGGRPYPDGAFGIHADAVGGQALGPHPPVGQAAIGFDVEGDESPGEGLRDDQRLVIRRNHHAIG